MSEQFTSKLKNLIIIVSGSVVLGLIMARLPGPRKVIQSAVTLRLATKKNMNILVTTKGEPNWFPYPKNRRF